MKSGGIRASSPVQKLVFILLFSCFSGFLTLNSLFGQNDSIGTRGLLNLHLQAANLLFKALQSLVAFVFCASLIALFIYMGENVYGVLIKSISKASSDNLSTLSGHELLLSGKKSKDESFGTNKPPKSKGTRSSSDLVPLHHFEFYVRPDCGSEFGGAIFTSPSRASVNEIQSEIQHEQLSAKVDENIAEGVERPAKRPVRLFHGTQKFDRGGHPPPLSMEQSIRVLKRLGIYSEIGRLCTNLRRWFSLVLLQSLLEKIESSHIHVMEAAARLGISVTVSQVGSDSAAVEDDFLLLHLQDTLLQALDASKTTSPLTTLQQSTPQNIQECVDAITEHLRLRALMKGRWGGGLLPQTNIPEGYMVQRIRELAEGSRMRNYEWEGGKFYDKNKKKWNVELPTDSPLLLYLFCAFLYHPQWRLHLDNLTDAGMEFFKKPLFLGVLPTEESFSGKYISVTSAVTSPLHQGASVLVVGRQSSPVFTLYWDKKVQFSLQGRTALWDSILILGCRR